MQYHEAINVYEMDVRKRPVGTLETGEFTPTKAPTLWRRLVDAGAAVIDVVRESRALETKLLQGRYRHLRDF